MKRAIIIRSEVLHACARAAHEANRAYCLALGDHTVPAAGPWEDMDRDHTQSVYLGVEGVLNGDTPAETHERWIATKAAQGWSYGGEKNAVLKTHPCMVPHERLPERDREKDLLFQTVCRSVAYALHQEYLITYEKPGLPSRLMRDDRTVMVISSSMEHRTDWYNQHLGFKCLVTQHDAVQQPYSDSHKLGELSECQCRQGEAAFLLLR